VLRSASERSDTDRIPVRAARAAAAARFRNAIVDSADGIVVQDSAGKVLLVSHSAEQLLGRTAAEITGSSLGLDISGGLPVRVHVVYERDGTTEFPRDGGEPRHFDVSQLKITELEVWPFPHEWAGTPVTVCAIRDVSQQSWDEYRQRQIASFDTPLHIAGGLKEACTDLALRLGRVVRYNRIELAIWRPDVRRHQVVFELGLTVHGRAIGSLVDRGTSPVQFGTWMERDTAGSPATGFVAIGHARHGEYGDREADALRRCAAAMGSVVSSVKADPIFGQYDAEQDRRGVTGRYPLSEAA
jgi:PAS domain S-box-containing protein